MMEIKKNNSKEIFKQKSNKFLYTYVSFAKSYTGG